MGAKKLKLLAVVLACVVPIIAWTKSLEKRLEPLWTFHDIDLLSFKAFKDFLIPNEWNPYLIKTHLDKIKKDGLLVSTGTERAFIALALCERCVGLVGVDLNPRVKAYNDFNTLLLKLSKNREDYLQIRGVNAAISLLDSHLRSNSSSAILDLLNLRGKKEEEIIVLTKTVADLLEKDQKIEPEFKAFYKNNLKNFANIFYTVQFQEPMLVFIDPAKKNLITSIEYPLEYFQKANYLADDLLFWRLKKLADSGSLVFVTGEIVDLDFLSQEQVVAIDASNIADYGPINVDKIKQAIRSKLLIINAKDQEVDVSFSSDFY